MMCLETQLKRMREDLSAMPQRGPQSFINAPSFVV